MPPSSAVSLEEIAKNQIDVVIFDPLVTLHSVSEMDTGKMDAVIRLFAGIADENSSAADLAHHVRATLWPEPSPITTYTISVGLGQSPTPYGRRVF